MATKKAPDRRQYPRIHRILSIQFRLKKTRQAGADTATWHQATTHDMSVGGISFVSRTPYMLGDILELHVVMSGVLDVLCSDGKVVRVEDKKHGLFLTAVELTRPKA